MYSKHVYHEKLHGMDRKIRCVCEVHYRFLILNRKHSVVPMSVGSVILLPKNHGLSSGSKYLRDSICLP